MVDADQIRSHLSATQIVLFRQMQPSEQWHAYLVMQRLKDEGQDHPALFTAALLHDVGKILYPLSLLERAMIVLGKWFFPRLLSRWGEGARRDFRRPFVVAERHADWGADLAARAGASEMIVNLIRRHQDVLLEKPHSLEDRLLHALQSADDSN
jgi:predicted HD phosphohydrolase